MSKVIFIFNFIKIILNIQLDWLQEVIVWSDFQLNNKCIINNNNKINNHSMFPQNLIEYYFYIMCCSHTHNHYYHTLFSGKWHEHNGYTYKITSRHQTVMNYTYIYTKLMEFCSFYLKWYQPIILL